MTCFCWPRLYDGFDGAPRRPGDRDSEAPALIGTYTVTAFASHVHSTRALNLLDPLLSICSCMIFILDHPFDVFNGCSCLIKFEEVPKSGPCDGTNMESSLLVAVMEVDSTAFSSFSFL